MAEDAGNVEQLLDVFVVKRHYMDDYVRAVEVFSADDSHEHNIWLVQGGIVAEEYAHLFPFRQKVLQTCKLAGVERVEDMQERYDQWHFAKSMASIGMTASSDGLVSAFVVSLDYQHLLTRVVFYRRSIPFIPIAT